MRFHSAVKYLDRLQPISPGETADMRKPVPKLPSGHFDLAFCENVLYQIEMDRQQAALAADRRAQVGSGERAEKIRTYNYKDNRVTDHRIGLTIKRLPEILAGNLDDLLDALILDDEASRLAGG